MKVVVRKYLVFFLCIALLVTTLGQPVIALNNANQITQVITKTSIEADLKAHKSQIETDLKYSKALIDQQQKGKMMVQSVPVVAVYFIPGVGDVAVLVTGAILVGGITIAIGTWLYNMISAWFASNDTEVADQGKDKDQLKGKPGEIKVNGNKSTRIGSDGRAVRQRHNTDHGNPKNHSKPHDHTITWDKNGNPQFSQPINYPNGNVPSL